MLLGLPPAFEGAVNLATTGENGAPFVINNPTEDPSGRGFQRTFQVNSEGNGNLAGKVRWGASNEVGGDGEVKSMARVGTTHADATIALL